MNSYLRQSWKIFSHIQLHPLGDIKAPETIKEQTKWCEDIWENGIVLNDNIKRHVIHNHKGLKTDKWTITVLSDEKYCYLVQVLRTEYNTDDIEIYMAEKSDSQIQDFINISKFMHRDIRKILNQSLKDVDQFNKLIGANKTDGQA